MRLKIAALTDAGCLRTNNEDIGLVHEELVCDNPVQVIMNTKTDSPVVIAVADGMGGHNGGEIASQIAVERLIEWRRQLASDADFNGATESFSEWVKVTDRYIREAGEQDVSLKGMGTTMVGLAFTSNTIFAFNIGDSRLYRFRDNWIRQISKDHSVQNLTDDPGVPSNLIYNSLGAGNGAFADYFDLRDSIRDNDLYLLCSDGLTDMVTEDRIEDMLKSGASARQLVDEAKEAGGRDNITVILVWVYDKQQKENE